MMRVSKTALVALLSATLISVGCKTSQRPSSSSDSTSGVVRYVVDRPPVWIFIPALGITPQAAGYPAEIALPPQAYTTNRIEVNVTGEVGSPGTVRVPFGCTVLQAICYAGGFTGYAHNKRLTVRKSSGEPVWLFLRSRRTGESGFRQAWYSTENQGPVRSPKDTSGTTVSDFVLQAGDKVHVPRAVF
jgi:hypothetical protein